MAVCGENGGVASRRIDRVERVACSVPGPTLLCQDPEVVAVQMDWVCDAVGGAISLCRENSGGGTYVLRRPMTLFWIIKTAHSSSEGVCFCYLG